MGWTADNTTPLRNGESISSQREGLEMVYQFIEFRDKHYTNQHISLKDITVPISRL